MPPVLGREVIERNHPFPVPPKTLGSAVVGALTTPAGEHRLQALGLTAALGIRNAPPQQHVEIAVVVDPCWIYAKAGESCNPVAIWRESLTEFPHGDADVQVRGIPGPHESIWNIHPTIYWLNFEPMDGGWRSLFNRLTSSGQSASMVQYNLAGYTSLFWLNPILRHYQHTLGIPDCACRNTRQPNFVVI